MREGLWLGWIGARDVSTTLRRNLSATSQDPPPVVLACRGHDLLTHHTLSTMCLLPCHLWSMPSSSRTLSLRWPHAEQRKLYSKIVLKSPRAAACAEPMVRRSRANSSCVAVFSHL